MTAGDAFFDQEFANLHSIPTFPVVTPRAIRIIDRRPIDSGDVTHRTYLGLHTNSHRKRVRAFITKQGYYRLLLWIRWPEAHNAFISFAQNTLTFDYAYYHYHCSPTRSTPAIATGISSLLPDRPTPPKVDIAQISLLAIKLVSRKNRLDIRALSLHEI